MTTSHHLSGSAESHRGTLTQAAVATLLLVAVLFPVQVTSTLLIGHVILGLLILLAMVRALMVPGNPFKGPPRAFAIFALVMSLFIVAQLATFDALPPRFWSEAPKFILVFAGAPAIVAFLGNSIWHYLPLIVTGFALNVLYLWKSEPNLYSYGGRFQVADLGSPNSMALMIAIVILVLVFLPAEFAGRRFVKIVMWPILILMAYVLLQTESRGGLIALAFGIVAGVVFGLPRAGGRQLSRRIGTFLSFLLAFGIALTAVQSAGYFDKLTQRLDISTSGDSGRSVIWHILVSRVLSSGPDFFTGFGPGSVQLWLNFDGVPKFVNSATSMLVAVLYSFGMLGFVAFMVATVVTWRRAFSARDSHATIRFGLLGALTFSCCVDNVMLSSQAVVATTIALAAVLTVSDRRQRGSEEPDAETRQHIAEDVSVASTEIASRELVEAD